MMNLLTELIIRVIIIVSLTDGIIFYVINKRSLVITVPLAISIIVVTIIPLVINIWFCLYRYGIK